MAGGFAKMTKLAAGHLDLHSSTSRVDPRDVGRACSRRLGADRRDSGRRGRCRQRWRGAGGGGKLAGAACRRVARRAREVALATLSGATAVEVAIVDRTGEFLARAGAEGSR